jgi:hypothetical protein
MLRRTHARPEVFAAALSLAGFLGFSLTNALLTSTAHAQPYPWRYPYYDGYPPPMPPGELAAREGYGQDQAYGEPPLPLPEIRRRVAIMGFRLVATPRRKNRIYLAEVEDVHGLRHRLVFDAYEGNVIQNTKLPPIVKKAEIKPDAGAATTAPSSAAGTETSAKVAAPEQAAPPVNGAPTGNSGDTK